jgi:hypothetical protein
VKGEILGGIWEFDKLVTTPSFYTHPMHHFTYLTLVAAAATALFPPPAAAVAVSQRALAKVGHIDSGLDFCWRSKYYRGVGKLPGTCPSGYPDKCGTVGLRPQCCKSCPEPELGFNLGKRKGNKRFCEYTPEVGGPSKKVYTKYTNAICGSDKPEEKAGLCYERCDDGYAAGGASLTECWAEPPKHLDYGWIKCGLGAARNAGICVTQVGEALMGALESALFIVSLGTSAMGSTAVKASAGSSKTVDAADAVSDVAKAAGALTDASKAADAAADSAGIVAKLKKFGMGAMKFMDPIEAGAMAGKRIRKALGLADKFSDAAGAVADSVKAAGAVTDSVKAAGAVTDSVKAAGAVTDSVKAAGAVTDSVKAAGAVTGSVKAAKEVADQVGYARKFVNLVDDFFSISRVTGLTKQRALFKGDAADILQAVKTLHKQLNYLTKMAAPLAVEIERGVNGYTSFPEIDASDVDGNGFHNPNFGKSICFLSTGVADADNIVRLLDQFQLGLWQVWEPYRPICEQNDEELIQSEEKTAEAESEEARKLEKAAEELSGQVQKKRNARSKKRKIAGSDTVTSVITTPYNAKASATSLLETLTEQKKKDHCALAEALDAEEEAEIDDELAEELAEFAPTAQGSAAIAQVEKEWNRIKNWVDKGMTKRVWATERLHKKVEVLQKFNDELIAKGKTSLVDQDKLAKAEAETAASTDQFLVDPFAAARTAIGLASLLDPSGISSNVAAYLYPNCCMYSAKGPKIGCQRFPGMNKTIEKKLERQEKKEVRKAKRAKTKACKQTLKNAKRDKRQEKRIARLEKNNPEKLKRVKKRQMAKSKKREKKANKKLKKDLAKGQKKQDKHAKNVLKKEEKEKKKEKRQEKKAAKKQERQEKKQARKDGKTAKKQGKADDKYEKKAAKAAKKSAKADKKTAKRSAKADKKAAKRSAKADKKDAKRSANGARRRRGRGRRL